MGLCGTILVFPKAGSPPTAPDPVARQAIAAFEKHGLLLPDTANHCETPTRWNRGTFAEHRENGDLAADEHALYMLKPGRITQQIQDIVHVADISFGLTSPIEVPTLEFSVTTKALPIINGYDGRTICTTWAVVAFSFGDTSYDEEIHRIRNDKHPIFDALSEVFSSPVAWDVQIG
jgi:hypothetical protein